MPLLLFVDRAPESSSRWWSYHLCLLFILTQIPSCTLNARSKICVCCLIWPLHLVGSSGDASVKKLLFEVTEYGYRFWTEDAARRKFLYCCDQSKLEVCTSCYYRCAVAWYNSCSGYCVVKEEYAEHYELYQTSRLLRNMSELPPSYAGDKHIHCFSCIFQGHSISCMQYGGVLSARCIVVPLSKGTVCNSTYVRRHVLLPKWVHGSLCNC